MIKIDLKDKRILRELFYDGRMPLSKIAKAVRLSKEVVLYRINRMLQSGLLLGFNSVYDLNKFGWQTYLVSVKINHKSIKNEEEIINSLKNHKNISWLTKVIGGYDLMIKFHTKDVYELNEILKNIEKKYNNFILVNKDMISKEYPIPVSYIYSPLTTKIKESKKHENKNFILKKIDLKILKTLSKNSRIKISDMSNKLKINRDTLNYHLKNLIKNNIITHFRPSLWSGSKEMGYGWYFIKLSIKQLDNQTKNNLLSYLKNNIHVSYIYELIGNYDFGFEIRLKTGDELNHDLTQIKTILKENHKSQEMSLILKEYKYTYFPDCINESI